MAGLFSRNLREMHDSAMLQRKTNPIAAGIPLKTAKNQMQAFPIRLNQAKSNLIRLFFNRHAKAIFCRASTNI